MRARDVAVLGLLILLVLVLTIVEKYGEHQREAQRQQEAAIERLQWQNRMGEVLDERWKELSVGLRRSLDSLVRATIAGGISGDSLVAVMAAAPVTDSTRPGAADLAPAIRPRLAAADSLVQQVLRDYRRALASLPGDLNSYERRVATNEVAALIRAKYSLSAASFDSLLSAVPE